MANNRSREATMNWIMAILEAAFVALMAVVPQANAEDRLRVNVFPGPQHVALYVAQERGLFAKRGLAVEIQFTPNAKAQREALADGSIEIAQSAVDNAVAMVEDMKKDVIIVAGGGNGMLNLFVRPEIKSYDAIRGKTVVVDSPDTAYALVLYKMLALKGIKKTEYGVFQGGDCMRRLNGIRNDPNNVAVLLNFPCNILAEREGYPDWGSAADALGAYQADGIWVMRDWARQHPETMVKYIEAIIEGLRWASRSENKGETAAIVAKILKVAPDVAEKSVEGAVGPHGGLDKDAGINMAGFRTLLSLRAEMIGGSADLRPEKYLDSSYYDRALAALK
jgi:ABC-type nitrate/sulfonate/bicarbonate transport system substrate-binding protein